MVLTCGLEDPAFNLGNIRVANVFMQGLYCGTLVSCFIFALGNRPQGSKWKYSCRAYLCQFAYHLRELTVAQ
jgi:chitin synthase